MKYFAVCDVKSKFEKGNIFDSEIIFKEYSKTEIEKYFRLFDEKNIKENYSVFFWDIQKVLSYNCLFNFIVGNRGGGKTYGCKKYVVKRFLKTKAQFIYLRRYSKELKKVKKFFDTIKNEFPEVEFEVKGKNFYINGELAGYAQELSTAKIQKSEEFPEVETIIFDEFIIDKGVYHYIPDEVTNFLEFYETVARLRDVTVFFLSNAITMLNPYFIYFDITLPYGKNIQAKNDKLIQIYNNQGFLEIKKATRFGKLINGTEYGNYNMHNQFLRDNKNFILKKSGNCELFFSFKYKGEIYGVWRNLKEGKTFVSNDWDELRGITYAITTDDLQPNLLLLPNLRKSRLFKVFLNEFQMGVVYFENMKIKTAVHEVVKLANIY